MNNKSLKFLYTNIRSLVKSNKLDELKCNLKTIKTTIHVILLTETWIKSDLEARSLQIPEYTHVYNFRKGRVGGGVSIYICIKV